VNSSTLPTSIVVLSSPCISGLFDLVTVQAPAIVNLCTRPRQDVAAGSLLVFTQPCSASGLSLPIIIAIVVGVVILVVVGAVVVGLVLYARSRPFSALFNVRGGSRDGVAIHRGAATESKQPYRRM
jgi:hypothetical protein